MPKQHGRALPAHSAASLNSFLLLASTLCLAAALTPAAAQNVVISEIMSGGSSNSTLPGAPKAHGWVELHNTGSQPVSLKGWTIQKSANASKAKPLPADATIPADGYLVLLFIGHDANGPLPAGAGWAGLPFQHHIRHMQLKRPDGSVASSIGAVPSEMPKGMSFGIPASATASQYVLLASPTPGAANSEAAAAGPLIIKATRHLREPAKPGEDITVQATVRQGTNPVDSVELIYRINFQPGEVVAMDKKGVQASGGDAASSGELWEGAIPGDKFKAGDIVRWHIRAKDSEGQASLLPSSNISDPNAPASFYGTYIEDEEAVAEVLGNSTLPVLHFFTEHEGDTETVKGGEGVLVYRGRLYDTVHCRRRGETALSWKKPKLKFNLPRTEFMWEDGAPPVKGFNLQSFGFELGENTYMKEVVGYRVMQEAGVTASRAFHLVMMRNGKFYGLFGFVEEVDDSFLKRNRLPTSGPLFKSASGELSNLRWDLQVEQYKFYWGKENRKNEEGDWKLLDSFAKGLAGAYKVPRSHYIFDTVYLPQVINEMAAQAVLNNMDRCTKNFFMYLNPVTGQWYRFPWDLDAALGQDNGLGGLPGTLWCILACEQWNSPLYCDSEHPQDLAQKTAWGQVTVVGTNTYAGPAVKNREGRRLQQQKYITRQSPKVTTWPPPKGWDKPDVVLTGSPSPIGAPGTYNHLADAILDVAPTRQMYLRRLRTLADKFFTAGRLKEIVAEVYDSIKDVAVTDAKRWDGKNIEQGLKQVVFEFIPIRSDQLLGLYGPNGTRPLLPEAQPNATAGIRVAEARVGGNASEGYMVVSNANDIAVDVSGWAIKAPAKSFLFTFPPGTVIPGKGSAYIVADVAGFKSRAESPKGGEGLFLLPLPAGVALPAGGVNTWAVVDAIGQSVSTGSA